MSYIAHEKLVINWINSEKSFELSLPWMSMKVDISEKDRGWIKDATDHLHSTPANTNVQRFINNFKDYPLFYIQPRGRDEFYNKPFQPCPSLKIDFSTPAALVSSFECEISDDLTKDIMPHWTWEWEKILAKGRIPGTDLYDPISFISYLICYRLEWESAMWSENGIEQLLEHLLHSDESQFFQAIGRITKQSWYKTKTCCQAMMPALIHFDIARDVIHHFMCDEVGHYKFMEEVFRDLGLDKEDFPIEEETRWLLAAHERVARLSPLAFSAMINLFDVTFYEDKSSISRLIKHSSKPHAAQGFELHYKITQDHRHCDMPLRLGQYLAPQTYSHAALTLGLFELTLNFLDTMKKRL